MYKNIEIFEECLSHPVSNIDKYAREALNRVVFSDGISEISENNEKLVLLLDKYKKINITGDPETIDKVVLDIDICLKKEKMNYSHFSQYLMVHNLTYETYLEDLNMDEKKYVLNCYIEDRHSIYKKAGYTDTVFQVISDNYAHKRKAVIGLEKIKSIAEDNNISPLEDGNIEKDSYYILPDGGDKDAFHKILEKYNINFKFEKTHQNKLPDALFKCNDKFIIVEHKNLKQTGGGQDKQINEIIDFIDYGERGVHYISFMDGILFNKLKNPRKGTKLDKSKIDIYEKLNSNPYNYFVNEYGFRKVFKNIIE